MDENDLTKLRKMNLKNLSLQEIRDYISLLKLHLNYCISSQKFIECDFVNKKIEELKLIESRKIFKEIVKSQKNILKKEKLKIQNEKDKILEEKNKDKENFNLHIMNLEKDFETKQKYEFEYFLNCFKNFYIKLDNDKNKKDFETKLKKLISEKKFLEANELVNEYELKKEKFEEKFEINKKNEILKGIENIKYFQKIEKEEFEKKIEKLQNNYKNNESKKFDLLFNKYNDVIKNLEKNQKIERENFNIILEESLRKKGIIMSKNMKDYTKKYIKNLKIKNN